MAEIKLDSLIIRNEENKKKIELMNQFQDKFEEVEQEFKKR